MDNGLLIVANADGEDMFGLDDYTLDLAYGSGENDFELTFEGERLEGGERIYIDGTGYGGIVDSVEYDTAKGVTIYRGRSWQGILNSKIIEPPPSNPYAYFSTSTGLAFELKQLLRIPTGNFFTYPKRAWDRDSDLKFREKFPRYCKAYDGLIGILNQRDLKLCFKATHGRVEMWIERAKTITSVDSDLMDFKIEKYTNKPNHLICLGKGELEDRTVIHLYVNSRGDIREVGSNHTVNGITEVYDYSNAEDEEELRRGGIERLKELTGIDKVEVDLKKNGDWEVGDIVEATDQETGIKVRQKITKKIVKVKNGEIAISYEIGERS